MKEQPSDETPPSQDAQQPSAARSTHALIPDHIAADIPSLYETSGDCDPLVHSKLFTPWAGWSWYITEHDGRDLCFGLIDGHERELGYFSLQELSDLRGPGGLRIERDRHFHPMPLSRVRAILDRPMPLPRRYAQQQGR